MSFTPFSIQCVTCGSRLKVRTPEWIGTITGCPKCGAMVQIPEPTHTPPPAVETGIGRRPGNAAPAQVVNESELDFNSDAVTREALLDDPGAQRTKDAGERGGGETNPSTLPPPIDQGERSGEWSAAQDDTGLTGGETEAPSPDWLTNERPSRNLGLILTIASTSFLLAAILFAVFVRSYQERATQASADASVVAAPDPPAAPDSKKDARSGGGSTGGASQGGNMADEFGSAADSADEPDSAGEVQASETVQTSDTRPTGSPAGDQSGIENEAGGIDAEVSESSRSPDPDAATTEVDSDLLPVSPLTGLPILGGPSSNEAVRGGPFAEPTASRGRDAGAGRGPVAGGAPEDATADASGQLDELPAGLSSLIPYVNLDSTPPAMPIDAPEPSEGLTEVDAAARRTVLPEFALQPLEPIEIERVMKVRLAIDSPGYPLANLTLVISQLTGVPIQIDWLGFDLAGLRVDAAVGDGVRGLKSADELLRMAAASAGATVEVRPRQIWLVPPSREGSSVPAALTALDDFGGERDTASEMVEEVISAVVIPGPLTASAEGAGEAEMPADSAEVAAGDVAAREALIRRQTRNREQLRALTTEAIRRMRGLPGKLDDAVLIRWARELPVTGETWPVLMDGEAGPAFDTAVSLAGLLRRTAQGNDAVVLVNWEDALRQRVLPTELVLPHTGGSAGRMLGETLSAWELDVRRVDADHWWVGDAATYDRLPIVVWTPPLGDRVEAFGEALRATLARAGGGDERTVYDPVSGRMLMLVPRFLARQLGELLRQPVSP